MTASTPTRWMLPVAGALLMAVGCGANETPGTAGTATTVAPAPTASATNTADGLQETTPPPPAVTPSGPAVIGSKASFEWTDGLEVWVPSAKRVVSKPDEYTDTERFVGVTVKVKNGTGEQFDLSSFTVTLRYGATGTEAENEYVSTDGYDGLNGRVAPGKTITGSFAFKVPGRSVPIAVEVNPGYDSEYDGYESAFFEGRV
jgi:hypothetical protein